MKEHDVSRSTLSSGEAHVWYAWTTHCCTPQRLAYYRTLLSDDERERLDRLAFEPLRHEYLLTRALCRHTLSRYAEIAPADWRFAMNEYGRPQITMTDAPTDLRFNLSNTRSLVACAVTRGVELGVDVERVERDADLLGIADRYFSTSELTALRRVPEDQQRQRFFRLWTLKESYIKARGSGLSTPLQQFSFEVDAAPRVTIAFDAALDDVAAEWQFAEFAPDEAHLLALALRRGAGPDWPVRIAETVPDRSSA